jgi:transposase
VTDRWSAYTWSPSWRRQLCWAHLLRDIDALSGCGGLSQVMREAWRAQARQMLHWWPRVLDGTQAHASFASDRRPVRREVERLLETGQTCGVPKTEGGCREVLKRRQALWTCVRHAAVEPTHSTAERAILPGVLWRKERFESHSPEGSRFVETMRTVVATLKQQHCHVLEYRTAACEAALCGQAAPSLLPLPRVVCALTETAISSLPEKTIFDGPSRSHISIRMFDPGRVLPPKCSELLFAKPSG